MSWWDASEAKKPAKCNKSNLDCKSPPLFFLLTPKHNVRIIINDIFADLVQARIESSTKLVVMGVHQPDALPDDSGTKAWSEGPTTWRREVVAPPEEYFDTPGKIRYCPGELFGMVVPL